MGTDNLSNLSKKNLLKFTAFTVTALSLSILGHGNGVYAADNAVTDKASTESDMATV